MSFGGIFNFRKPVPLQQPQGNQHVVIQKVLHRVLAFTGHTIDDVVNNPIAKRHVLGFYKLHKWVDREMDISDLESQWNSLGR
jgi:hypothetical protein